MPQTITRGYKILLEEANAKIETLAPAEAMARQACGGDRRVHHKPVFAEDKRFVFFCAGGWRSALAAAAAQEMGLRPVAHLDGGFGAWMEAGGPVETIEKKPPKDAEAPSGRG